MTSIRRTVLLNVVCLLVITLGVVTAIVYSTSVEAIRDKRKAAESLVESRYQDNRDNELRKRADKLAGDVQSDFNRTGFRNHWVASQLSALGTPTAPCGQAPLLVSLATSLPGPACLDLNTRLVTELKLNEDEIYRQDQVLATTEFIQISGEWGAPWTSKSLGSHTLPLHESDIERDPEGGVHFDSLTLPNGTPVRRVILKAPITRFSRTGNFWLPRPDGPPPSRAVTGLAAAARAGPREPREPQPGWPRRRPRRSAGPPVRPAVERPRVLAPVHLRPVCLG